MFVLSSLPSAWKMVIIVRVLCEAVAGYVLACCTDQTAGTWCVAHVDPVGAIMSVKVLAPVFVETTASAAATHGVLGLFVDLVSVG